MGLQLLMLVRVQSEEHIDLFLIHDKVGDLSGDAVLGLGQFHGLHILILHCIGQGPGECDRFGKLPKNRNSGTGIGNRHAEIDQQDENHETGR